MKNNTFFNESSTESNLTEQYRSNDMMSGKASSLSVRDDIQSSNANIWVIQNEAKNNFEFIYSMISKFVPISAAA